MSGTTEEDFKAAAMRVLQNSGDGEEPSGGQQEGLRSKLKKLLSETAPEPTEEDIVRSTSERVRSAFEELVWPEKELEVKRQKRINQVREQADG